MLTHLPVQQRRGHHGDDVSLLWVDVEHVWGGFGGGLSQDVVAQLRVLRAGVVGVERSHAHHCGSWERGTHSRH